MADQFADWKRLLELAQTHKTKSALREAIIGAGIQVLETEPMSGYYRCAAVKNGPLLPVAIWRDGGKLIVLRSGEPVALERVWPYSVWTPISYEWYEAATERGEKWPDEHVDAPVASQSEPSVTHSNVAATTVPATDREVTTNDNKPPEESEVERAKREIETAKANTAQYIGKVNSEESAAAAQALRARLNELANKADKRRVFLMAPFKEKADAIHADWQPLVKEAKAGADAIRDLALKPWENKKFKIEQEAQRKRDEEARKVREENERKRAEAEAAGKPAPEPVAEPEQTTPIAATSGTIKGASGRAAKVTTIKVAKVVDYDKAFQHLKAIPEIKQAIDKVAQRLVAAGNTVPGVEVNEERDVA